MVPEVCQPQHRGGRGLVIKRRGTRGLLAEAAATGTGRHPTRRFASSLPQRPRPAASSLGLRPQPRARGRRVMAGPQGNS